MLAIKYIDFYVPSELPGSWPGWESTNPGRAMKEALYHEFGYTRVCQSQQLRLKNRVMSGTDSRYWASEQNNSNNGYYVRFDTGATTNNNKTNSYRARCVRGYITRERDTYLLVLFFM